MRVEEGCVREVKRVVASFGVSQSLCLRRARIAVSRFGVVENWDRENNKNLVEVMGFRGTTTGARVRGIIFVFVVVCGLVLDLICIKLWLKITNPIS